MQFTEAIELLDFKVDSSFPSHLVLVSDLGTVNNLTGKEIFSLEQAKKFEADAVYFRRFDDGRTPIAQIYIYDNTKNSYKEIDYARIHRNLWSSCIVPMFIVICKSNVLIYDSRKPVSIIGDDIATSPMKNLEYAGDAIKQFSAKLFDNGTFWELKDNNNHFLSSTSAYQDLIDGLKKIRSKFIVESGLPTGVAHKLLVLSILVKYLEERGDEGGSMFAKTFLKKNFQAEDFCDVLRKGKVIELFEKLGSQFNGKIFEWENAEEVKKIEGTDLSGLANYLDGNLRNDQYVLWRLYSFKYLPIELISSVYEEFLGKEKKDVVYTPDFLVNLLVDECMPIDVPQDKFKVIDVSCGSGIFLVKVYKRLVEWWRYQQYQKNKQLQNVDIEILKEILHDNIFGIDIEKDATRLTVFSLALALCDMLSPKEIWTKLKFDDLTKKNIHAIDFFKYLSTAQENQFDLVIGNPPFVEFNTKEFNKIFSQNNLSIECKIPQNQIALLFLDKAMRLVKKNKLLCLILPSGPLLYNDTLEFRNYFFKKNNVIQLLDFTNLSSIMFGKANVATCALFAENKEPDSKDISHITVRRTKAVKERIIFELDHYDFHKVTKEEAIENKFIWKSNLIGGGRIINLINRLSSLRTFGQYLKEKNSLNNWKISEGFSVGNKSKKADFITGKRTVRMKDFDVDGIHKTEIETEPLFEAIREKNKEIFKAPHLLIKEVVSKSKIPAVFLDYDLTFTNRVVGIHAPKKDIEELKRIYQILDYNSELNTFYAAATSNQYLIGKASALLKKDIDNLPFPENMNKIKYSFSEKILINDVIDYMIDFLNKGHNSKISSTLVKESHLSSFASVYCKAINSIYQEGDKKFQLYSIIDRPTFTGTIFHYTHKQISEPKIDNSLKGEEFINQLIVNRTGENLRIMRVLKIYEKDKIYIIKPKNLRYWLKSIALKDADETFDEILDTPNQ